MVSRPLRILINEKKWTKLATKTYFISHYCFDLNDFDSSNTNRISQNSINEGVKILWLCLAASVVKNIFTNVAYSEWHISVDDEQFVLLHGNDNRVALNSVSTTTNSDMWPQLQLGIERVTSMYSLTFRVRVMLPYQRSPRTDCKSARQCTTRWQPLPFSQVTSGSVQ